MSRETETLSDESTPEADGPTGAERRQWPRLRLDLQVSIRFASAEDAMSSQTFDISRGGVFIRSKQPRPEGTGVRLSLQVGERTLVIGGVVVRVVRPGDGLEPPGIGVMFTELSTEDGRFLEALLSKHTASEP